MNKEQKPLSVSDRPAEVWIKVLSLVALITLPLIGVIGTMVINNLERINNTITAYSTRLENHEGRISRSESDVKAVLDVQADYGKRIYKLEGKHYGR